MIDLELFREILSIDSTSGNEAEMAAFLYNRLEAPEMELIPSEGAGPELDKTFLTFFGKKSFSPRRPVGPVFSNVFLKWGVPKVVFCTHMDTVPPYIPPTFEEDRVKGRGSCDAKGQLIALYTACKRLEAEGQTGFGLLILTGEETGSWGAKAFSKWAKESGFSAPYLIVGEPTENKMVSASKGTKSYDLTFHGKAFHSGYPEYGVSAVDLFLDFMKSLRAMDWGKDPSLGKTTWNVGLLRSDNPQNILSPELTCRLYFRTTFVSDSLVDAWIQGTPTMDVVRRGGDTPARYFTVDGVDNAPAAFGTDAPHLTCFARKSIFGPGTVKVAHRPDEFILLSDLEAAIDKYVKIFKSL